MKPIFKGFRLVFREKSLRSRMWVPLLASFGLYVFILIVGCLVVGSHWAAASRGFGLGDGFGWVAGSVFVYVFWTILSGPVCLAFCNIVSAIQWDQLGRQVERLNGSEQEFEKSNSGQLIVDGVLRGGFALFLSVMILIFGWTFFGITAVILGGILSLSEFTGPVFMRRGHIFPIAFFRAFKLKGAWGFLLVSGVISLIPFVGVLFHAGLAAGATLLVLEDEEARSKALASPKVE